MKAETVGTAVCGVWIEFLDAQGHTVERHVIDEWQGRPIPDRGDAFQMSDIVGVRRFRGQVIGREFDLQHSCDGEPRLWVRLTVRVTHVAKKRDLPEFSYN